MVPKTYPNLPKGFLERIFRLITAREIRAPDSRSVRNSKFDAELFQDEMRHRLAHAAGRAPTEEEFLTTSDLA